MNWANQFKKIYSCDENYFEEIESEEKAYILGFISADGNISKTALRIRLQILDIDILQKIKICMNSNHNIIEYFSKIKDKVYKSCGIQICSVKIKNDLLKYGITNNKSETINIPNIREDLIIYWIKGYFDGNGTIDLHSKKYPRIRICSANKDLLNNIIIFFNNTLKTKVTNISKISKKCYEIYYMSEDVVKIYNAFYEKNNIYLERKFEKFKNIINQYHRI